MCDLLPEGWWCGLWMSLGQPMGAGPSVPCGGTFVPVMPIAPG